MNEDIFDIAIIGAGAAGQMGTLRAVLNNKQTIVFTGDATTIKKARATWVSSIVNMPYTAGIKNPITKATKETFNWIKNDPYFKNKLHEEKDSVIDIKKLESSIFEISTKKGNKFLSKYILLATGIMDIQPSISDSIDPILPYANNGHIDYCIRCDGHKSVGKITATIGHKNPAAWVAILLYERYAPPEVKIFTNGEEPDFSDDAKQLLALYKIKVVKEKIVSISGDPKIKMEGFNLANGSLEPVEIAFVLLGQIAYNELALKLDAKINEKGNVIANEKGESTVPGLYVAGDLRDTGKYQIYTAWDQAVDSIDDIDLKIRLESRNKLKQHG